MRFFKLKSPLFAVGAITAGLSTPVLSQLEEVIVTAQKREQSLLDVPVAVTAITAAQLENAGVQNFNDLVRLAPSLTMNQSNTANSSSITLRGIGTYAFSIAVEPSVSVVIDDVANARQLQAFSNLSDIERVEVLRGPQGTLFGKNASAGVISVVTKAPSDELTGSIEATVTDDDEFRVSGSLSGPMGENAGFRLNAYISDRDGHITNLTNDSDLSGDEGFGVRGKIQFEPNEKLGVTLIADYNERDTSGPGFTLLNVPEGSAFIGAIPNAIVNPGLTPGPNNLETRLSDDPLTEAQDLSVTARVSYDLGNMELVSITNYQESEYEFFADVDGTDFDLLGLLTGGAASGGLTQGGPFDTEQFTQELRLSGSNDTNLDYMLGLFYANTETDRAFSRGPILFLAEWFGGAGSESLAAFGQATYSFTDATRLTGGLRVGREEIDVEYTEVATAEFFSGDDDDSYVTGKLALQHELTDNMMVFGSVSTGYKGQGYDVTTGFTQDSIDNLVKSEESTSFEIGAKGTALDGNLQYSVVAFSTQYDDFQAQSALADQSGAISLALENVGEMETQGVELELAAQVSESLRLDVGVAYINAEVKSFAGAQCFPGQTVAQGCVGEIQDLAGSPLANAPDLKFNLGAIYEFAIPNTGFNAFFGANYVWQDDINYDLFGNPRTVQESYGVANLRLGLVRADSPNFEVSLFMNNAFDEQYASQIFDFGALWGNNPVMVQNLSRNAQRYAGLKLKVGF